MDGWSDVGTDGCTCMEGLMNRRTVGQTDGQMGGQNTCTDGWTDEWTDVHVWREGQTDRGMDG